MERKDEGEAGCMSGKTTKTRRTEIPDALKPIAYFTDLLPPKGSSDDWQGDCPLCNKPHHFFANAQTGQWDCKVCGDAGNVTTFLTKYIESVSLVSRSLWRALSKSRGLPTGVMRARGMCHDGREWLIPCYGETGTVRDIRRYDGRRVMSTPGCSLQLGGIERLAKAKAGSRVWIVEGEWDAMALDWVMKEAGRKDVVTWVPGASIFKQQWKHQFSGMQVTAVYDNDEAGDRGQAKIWDKLLDVADKLEFVNWPDTRPSGFDLRDYVLETMGDGGSADDVLKGLSAILDDEPRRGIPSGRTRGPRESDGKINDDDVTEIDFDELIRVFGKYAVLNDDMVIAMKVILAVAVSVDIFGTDPLWCYIVAPPASGKTMLLAALQNSIRCVFRSTLTRNCLVSGWKGEGAKDPSLIPKLKGKCFIAKDFTEVLAMNDGDQEEIFSTLRGAYDGSVHKQYGNGVIRHYEDCWFSMLAGVTHVIHGSRRASMGERFLKFQMDRPTRDHETKIKMRAMNNIGQEKLMETAMQRAATGFLKRRMPIEDLPHVPDIVKHRINALVDIIAALRANVERHWKTDEPAYRPTIESGTRLARQLCKLAICVAWVDGKSTVDESVWETIKRVAFNTAYGFHLDIIDAMIRMGGSATRRDVAMSASIPDSTTRLRFEDLEMLKVVERTGESRIGKVGGRPATLYRVNPEIADMWRAISTPTGEPTCTTVELNKTSPSSTSVSKPRRRRRFRSRLQIAKTTTPTPSSSRKRRRTS